MVAETMRHHSVALFSLASWPLSGCV